jgi:1-acyl-sn-glycerol-3-phosphate acyltransferase
VDSEQAEPALPATSRRAERPELFSAAKDKLGFLERANIRLIRRSFTIPLIDRTLTWFLRVVGAGWVHHCTKHIRTVVGLERVPPYIKGQPFILVSNHRSFFDMFVLNMLLYKAGWRHRLLFPVRSSFFYDHPLGFFVNGAMSFWSMYPPIFRDRKKAALNHTAFNEMIVAMKEGGRAAGIHPEGTRKKDDDPYTFLPAQSGIGRAIHKARVPVYPAFINGLGNDLPKQVLGNFTRKGRQIIAVFGEPIDFGALLDEPPTGRVYKLIADKTLEVIGALGREEKAVRAQLYPDPQPALAAPATPTAAEPSDPS